LFKDASLVGIVGPMDLLLATKQALGDPACRSFSLSLTYSSRRSISALLVHVPV
jgi:hypothetical protein